MKKEVKFIAVFDCPGDFDIEFFATEQAAVDRVDGLWGYLTAGEKRNRCYSVYALDRAYTEEEVLGDDFQPLEHTAGSEIVQLIRRF